MNSPHEIFEDRYLEVRRKEQRVYSDEQVKRLPYISPNDEQKAEWRLRVKTTTRFLEYIRNKNAKHLLDLGCGNGWFTHLIANELPNTSVIGGDINRFELDQAARCFTRPNLSFEMIDLFDYSPAVKFDVITINAAIQYFPSISRLMDSIVPLLADEGEFHVLDSPVYQNSLEAELAKKRTIAYYQQMEVPEMAASYHHHTWENFKAFQTLYLPKKNKLVKKLRPDSPFPWLYFKNSNRG